MKLKDRFEEWKFQYIENPFFYNLFGEMLLITVLGLSQFL